MFLSAFDLPKAVYIATAGAIGLLVDSTRIITYVTVGTTLPKELWYGLFLFSEQKLPSGSLIEFLKISFERSWLFFLLAIGIKLLLWP